MSGADGFSFLLSTWPPHLPRLRRPDRCQLETPPHPTPQQSRLTSTHTSRAGTSLPSLPWTSDAEAGADASGPCCTGRSSSKQARNSRRKLASEDLYMGLRACKRRAGTQRRQRVRRLAARRCNGFGARRRGQKEPHPLERILDDLPRSGVPGLGEIPRRSGLLDAVLAGSTRRDGSVSRGRRRSEGASRRDPRAKRASTLRSLCPRLAVLFFLSRPFLFSRGFCASASSWAEPWPAG